MTTYDERYKEYTDAVNAALDHFLPVASMPQKKLLESMRYSLFAGGKRLRPVMLLDFCRICGGDWKKALPFACAVEMIHTYSLIHDDMPCMDNDDDRRGKPTNHIVFGETTALLAGSALLSGAFEIMLRPHQPAIPPERALQAAYIIACSSGLYGIAGGQELDLHHGAHVHQEHIHTMKTAALFIAAAEAGCVIAGAPLALQEKAVKFGEMFGVGFQFADDFMDSHTRTLEAALTDYKEALDILRAFEGADFLTEMVERLSAKLHKGVG